MNITYVPPLERAWARMTRMLFRPFALERWLVLGFAAFLSETLGGTQGGSYGVKSGRREVVERVAHSVRSFFLDPFWAALLMWLALSAVVLAVVIVWVNARGKFVFLDNVVHERTGIVEPWKRFKRLGNSLFRWKLLYYAVLIVALVLLALPFLGAIVTAFKSEEFRLPAIGLLLVWMPLICAVGIVALYFFTFLDDFVIPIMYRDDLTVPAAWDRFMPLFRANVGRFLAYGLMVLVLSLAVGVACATVGFATCCVGFVLMALPYVGAVIMLPVEVTMRALGPEFLAQFGPEWNALAPGGATPAPPAPGGTVGA